MKRPAQQVVEKPEKKYLKKNAVPIDRKKTKRRRNNEENERKEGQRTKIKKEKKKLKETTITLSCLHFALSKRVAFLFLFCFFFLPSFTEFRGVGRRFSWIGMGSYLVLPSLEWVLAGFTWFYLVLPSFT